MRRIGLVAMIAAVAAFSWYSRPFGVQAQAAAPDVTFTKDVLPILQKNCQSCHRPGEVAPFSLLSYQEARPYAKAIKNAVAAHQMPPWFADDGYVKYSNDKRLSQKEIDTLVAWVDKGAAEGDPKDAPTPVQFAD